MVVAIETEVERKVVASPDWDTEEREVMLDGDTGDDGE